MWKTILGRRIYSSSQLEIYENFLYRWLRFNSSALQTLINKRKPWKPALHYLRPLISAAKIQPAACCILGLGGGGAVLALAPFLKDEKLLVIEHSQEVIKIAQQFFNIKQLTNVELLQNDAALFIQQSSKKFQHLLVDLFNATAFPANCNNDDFFINCKNLLTIDGILAVNLASKEEHWPLFQRIRKQFLTGTVVVVVKNTSNIIIFAMKQTPVLRLIDILQQAQVLEHLSWNEKWGWIGMSK